MKRPQTKFDADTMSNAQVITSKFIVRSNFSWSTVFSLFDILLKLQQQILMCFCMFSYNSVIILGLLSLLT